MWSAGASLAVFGFGDPFDLVTFVQERFPLIRGTIDGDLFVIDRSTFLVGGHMLSADNGSAAMFTALPGGHVDMARFEQLAESHGFPDDDNQPFRARLVHNADTDDHDLIDIVVNGVVGDVRVFAELTH